MVDKDGDAGQKEVPVKTIESIDGCKLRNLLAKEDSTRGTEERF